MKPGSHLFALVLIAGCTACAALRQESFTIRPVGEAAAGSGGMTRTVAAGDALVARGEYALAVDAYRQAVYDDPSNAGGYNGMAIAYASMGRYDLSGRFFELALSRAPADAKIYRNLARSLEQQGRHEEALAVRREMEDAVRLAEASKAAEQLAVVTPERPSLAALAAEGERTPSIRQEDAKSNGAPYLERRSLGEVVLVTRASKLVARPPTAPTPAKPEHAARAGNYDTLFSRLWAGWPAPRAVRGDRQSGAL